MKLKEIKKEIKNITKRRVTIVAVTKNKTTEQIKKVIEDGILNIGENRWQEAKGKIEELPKKIKKHFIGHLQTNKIKEVVSHFDMIQSVDSLKLAQKINDECKKIKKIMPILIQVNTSHESQKGGIAPNEAIALVKQISELSNLKIEGLMTIGVNSKNEIKVRSCFKLLKWIFDKCKTQKIPMKYLSMGMSNDYKIAVEEGANMIRIGRKLFTD